MGSLFEEEIGINFTLRFVGGKTMMLYNAEEQTLTIQDVQMDYITFGNDTKPLIMIQGLNTNGIKGSVLPLSFMYRIFAKDYKVSTAEKICLKM